MSTAAERKELIEYTEKAIEDVEFLRDKYRVKDGASTPARRAENAELLETTRRLNAIRLTLYRNLEDLKDF